MSPSTDLNALSTPRKLLLGGGILLLINSFLPWYHASLFGVSVNFTGWHQLGTLAWIILIGVLIWEGLRIAGVAPVTGRQADLASAVGALAAVVVGVIFVIQRLSDGGLGIGFWLGIVLLVVVGYGAFQLFQASGGQAALRDVQQQAQQQAAERRAAQADARPTPPSGGAAPQDPSVPPSAPAPQGPPSATAPQDPATAETPEGAPQDPPSLRKDPPVS